MYDLKPRRIHMLESVRSDPRALRRVERMVHRAGMTMGDVHVYSREDAPDVVRELRSWSLADASGDVPPRHQRAWVFVNMVMAPHPGADPVLQDRPDDVPEAELSHALGYIQQVRDTHAPDRDLEMDMVCWNTQDFGLMIGCPHGCQYCGQGKNGRSITIVANVEEWIDGVVAPTIERFPEQKCFRLLGWGADIATFEPEYEAFGPFLAKLAEYPDRYGYFHTAGDNVDWVQEEPNRDRLIGVWSLTTEFGGARIEPATPSPAQRIEAARKCQEWGVPVRFKFKPAVPVRGWREQFAREIGRIFEHTRPESIGFACLMWMSLEQVAKCIPLELLDEEFVAAAEAAKDELGSVRVGPFPHEKRKELYQHLIREVRKHDAKVKLYVSTESNLMWQELADELGQDPRAFICGCNPVQLPGPRLALCQKLPGSTYTGTVSGSTAR